MLISAHTRGIRAICQALDLPKFTVEFTLSCKMDEILTLETTSYVEDGTYEKLITTLKQFELKEKE